MKTAVTVVLLIVLVLVAVIFSGTLSIVAGIGVVGMILIIVFRAIKHGTGGSSTSSSG